LDSDSDNDLDLDTPKVQTSEQRKEEKKYKRFKLNKSKEDSIPLPDPFELPKNYRPDVTAALASGKMTLETKTFFLSTIAGAMFTYKRYPSSDDYTNVARATCAKYPFMKVRTLCKLVNLYEHMHKFLEEPQSICATNYHLHY
jgi:hypothetical protein